ncbi:hypothetical protein SCHPADRAFT_309040 [Schizopora paradoxa]|uniref:Uncharacterized protein n=1 Tax=Schizopora paradoxa TaxID=27342 RepID=A0A0H2RSG7_9AGAM|nr:hypothetical protein SCHPADRAFT_309040 [Schizopora paradoxa]
MGSFGAEYVDKPPETIAYTAENGERAFYRRDADAERNTIFMNSSATGSHRSFFSATSSNATIPNVAGPGRILGNLLEAAGGSVERNIGLFAYKTKLHPAARAEQRLKDWSLSTEGDAGFLLRCLAASDRPSLQLAAFRVRRLSTTQKVISESGAEKTSVADSTVEG